MFAEAGLHAGAVPVYAIRQSVLIMIRSFALMQIEKIEIEKEAA